MNTIELLERFVTSKSDPREFLHHPFARGDWVYATNGHIAVRIPRVEGIAVDESAKLPNIEALFANAKCDNFVAIPDLPPAAECQHCKGSGIIYKCRWCDGEGKFEYGPHTYECRACDGTGQVNGGDESNKTPCVECNGFGEYAHTATQVGNMYFARRYLALIEKLPGLKFASAPNYSSPAYFVFDGGEGILMPMLDK